VTKTHERKKNERGAIEWPGQTGPQKNKEINDMVKTTKVATLVGLFATSAAFAALPAAAANPEIEALKAELARLAQRISELEAGSQPALAPKPVEKQEMAKSSPAVKVKGDFRYRYEFIDEQNSATRNRNRMRARVGVSGKVNDAVTAVVQLASGGDDPVSTNQTLDDSFSTKDLGIDLAYVTWQAAENIEVTAGKMKNPLHRAGGNALVWDSDLNPEGVALRIDRGRVFANAAGLFVEERSSSEDSFLLAAQLGFNTEFENGMDMKAGVGYFIYTNTAGNSPFYDGSAQGNTVVGGVLVNDYKELEVFAELGMMLGELPVSVFADWLQNTEVDAFDTAYAIGVKLGKTSAPGSWDFAWIYQDIEADALIGTFSNSDFSGGGTDASGQLFTGKYVVAKNWTAGFTYFLNETDKRAGADNDYRRLQADLQFKF